MKFCDKRFPNGRYKPTINADPIELDWWDDNEYRLSFVYTTGLSNRKAIMELTRDEAIKFSRDLQRALKGQNGKQTP